MLKRNWMVSLCVLLVVSALSFAQDPEEDGVRGSFLTSRPATSSSKPVSGPVAHNKTNQPTSSRPKSHPPKGKTTGQASVDAKKNNNLGSSKTTSETSGIGLENGEENVPKGPIGLGYSLFMRDNNGNAVRVDPNRDFHKGDSIRLSLEPNTDGYLYVFYTENDGNPLMLYPDARLSGGDNKISAHVPYEVPSSFETDPSRRWFVFDQNPATEHLYVVVSRRPLPGIPTGDDLIAYCNGQLNCTWKPTEPVWASVKVGLSANVHVSVARNVGQVQTEAEKTATTRGLGLSSSAPAPTVIRMTASSNAPVLVTKVDLNHK
jgi:hypothetical protein